MAQAYRKNGQFLDALEALSEASRLEPKQAQPHLLAGEIFAQLGNFESALSELDQAAARSPKDPAVFYARGQLLQSLESYTDALSEFGRAISLAPDHSLSYVARAEVGMILGRNDDARSDLTRAQELAPDDPALVSAWGSLHESLGDPSRALVEYKRALELEPGATAIRRNLAAVLVSLEAYDWATEQYDILLAADPSDADLWAYRAWCRLLWGRDTDERVHFEESMRSAEKAVDLVPNHEWAYVVAGAAAAALGKCTKAQRAFAATHDTNAYYAFACWEEAKGLTRCGRDDAAAAAVERLAGCGPEWAEHVFVAKSILSKDRGTVATADAHGDAASTAETHVDRALLFYEWDAWENVVDECEAALAQDDSDVNANNQLAWTLAEKLHRDLDRCILAAEKSARYATDDGSRAMSLDTLGWVWHLKGDDRKALEYLDEAVRLAEPDVLKRTHRARVADALSSK